MLDPKDIRALPDRFTDFPFAITVDTWWPLVLVLLAIAAIALFWYLRRSAR
jgi:hypothetical protein